MQVFFPESYIVLSSWQQRQFPAIIVAFFSPHRKPQRNPPTDCLSICKIETNIKTLLQNVQTIRWRQKGWHRKKKSRRQIHGTKNATVQKKKTSYTGKVVTYVNLEAIGTHSDVDFPHTHTDTQGKNLILNTWQNLSRPGVGWGRTVHDYTLNNTHSLTAAAILDAERVRTKQ